MTVKQDSKLNKKGSLIKKAISSLPKNKNLHEFSRLFLDALSTRSLIPVVRPELNQLLQDRFQFFVKSVQDKHYGFHLTTLSYSAKWLENNTLLELVYPDANHLLITIETILRKYNLRITRKLHPIFSITRNKNGSLKQLSSPKAGQELVSYVYIVFEKVRNDSILEDLKKDIQKHMHAVQITHQAQENLIKKLAGLKPNIQKQAIQNAEPKQEWLSLIDWLNELNFSFFGYAGFQTNTQQKVSIDTKTRLGLLSPSYSKTYPQLLNTLSTHVEEDVKSKFTFKLDTIHEKSPVQRFDNLMRLSVRLKNKDGNDTIHNFIGILKKSSLYAKNSETPLIHLKMAYIFKEKNMVPGSYDYNEVIRIFTAIPKFELFRTSREDLLEMVENLLSITNPNHIHCFAKKTTATKQHQFLIILPPFLFNEHTIEQITTYFKSHAPYKTTEVIRIPSDDKCRLHIYMNHESEVQYPNEDEIENILSQKIRPWIEQLRHYLIEAHGKIADTQLLHYFPLIPNHYKERTHPKAAIDDLIAIDKLTDKHPVSFRVTPFNYPESSDLAGKASIIKVCSKLKIDLITIIPILKNLGLHVIDQLTARIGDSNKTYGFIQIFRVTDTHNQRIDHLPSVSLIENSLNELFQGNTEDDPLNTLSLLSNLPWQSINILMLYRNYFLQLSTQYSKEKINNTLLKYPECTEKLFDYFNKKFNPEISGNATQRQKNGLPKAQQKFIQELKTVQDLSEDVIFRKLFNLIQSSVRTNFYQQNTSTAISVKFDSKKIIDIPSPCPFREIYVHDVGLEGIHIRFGKVSRGGLRWSSREDDFRTEVLGLVKTQQSKNVVIVPEGSKGGFIIKNQTDNPHEESKKQYQKFISSLLDITDNILPSGKIKTPDSCIIYEDSDPYLVVAADKGTATFSDIANDISKSYQFWLGDAFASGGSVGYDHKKLGITAKGAWECAKLHFKELNWAEDRVKTAAGIGDMSGDVFGNGFLLSKNIKLCAAFNHLHIFIDPNPNPEKSWKERSRLFKLSRSTWKDYNGKLLSKGGGIYDRHAKEIQLSKEAQTLLKCRKRVVSGEELIRTILKMQVDFLWFGGIGTYIKSQKETHSDVGDFANDAVRIDATDCQAQIISEGANLGVTELGRIELSNKGQLINTDAIDNSAGVNMSDYEVNLKIMLYYLLNKGKMNSETACHKFLEQAAQEVTDLVLQNNQKQHQLISLGSLRSKQDFNLFGQLIQDYIDKKILNPVNDCIPSKQELHQLELAKKPLPRPVLANVQAAVKMQLYKNVIKLKILDNPFLEDLYKSYFPNSFIKKFKNKVMEHQLKREITCMLLTNKLIDQSGITGLFHLQKSTGKSIEDIIQTYLIVDSLLKGEFVRETLQKESVTTQDHYKALIFFESTIQNICRDLLQAPFHKPLSFSKFKKYETLIENYKSTIQNFSQAPSIQWQQLGFSETTSIKLGLLHLLESIPEAIHINTTYKLPMPMVAKLLFELEEVFSFDWLENKLRKIDHQTTWDLEQRDILLQTLFSNKLGLIQKLIKSNSKKQLTELSMRDLLSQLPDLYSEPLSRYFNTLAELKTVKRGSLTLTKVSVCINRLQAFSQE